MPPRSVVLYNAPRPSTHLAGGVAERRLAGVAPLAGWWAGEPATREALAALRGRPVVAAAGLARPGRFFDMLRAEGLDIVPLPLPDHHAYDTLPWPADAGDVVVTEKDAVKLRRPAGAAAAAAARVSVGGRARRLRRRGTPAAAVWRDARLPRRRHWTARAAPAPRRPPPRTT